MKLDIPSNLTFFPWIIFQRSEISFINNWTRLLLLGNMKMSLIDITIFYYVYFVRLRVCISLFFLLKLNLLFWLQLILIIVRLSDNLAPQITIRWMLFQRFTMTCKFIAHLAITNGRFVINNSCFFHVSVTFDHSVVNQLNLWFNNVKTFEVFGKIQYLQKVLIIGSFFNGLQFNESGYITLLVVSKWIIFFVWWGPILHYYWFWCGAENEKVA